MGWDSNRLPWPKLERLLSGATPAVGSDQEDIERRGPKPAPKPVDRTPWAPGEVPYAELHCHSNFSFLDGASTAEDLAGEAARLGLEALALTDHDGLYGVVRFPRPPRSWGCPRSSAPSCPSTCPSRRTASPTRPATTCWSWPGTRSATAGSAGRSARPSWPARRRASRSTTCPALAELHRDHWLVLTGCRKGAVPAALVDDGPAAARRALADLVACFGQDNVAVEIWDHGIPLDCDRNDGLADLAARARPAAGRHQQRPLRHPGRLASWPPPSPRCGPGGQPRRDRRLAARRPPPPTCEAARRWHSGSPATPARSNGPPSSG